MSCTFQTASPKMQKLDPSKRVNYTFGLVLGVEEFLQSDTYFLAKDYLANRLLHGYGTVCGLEVKAANSPPIELQVAPGWAINPKGQEIHVPQLMCVKLNDWVQANLQALKSLFSSSAPPSLNLCVVLCYRECKTDVVPIPGEPCQTQSSSMAPSRIADSFELMLCLDPDASPPIGSPPGSPPSGPMGPGGLREFRPSTVELDAIQAFAGLLSEIEVSPTGPYLTERDLDQLVRDLAPGSSGWPGSFGSPPSGPPYYVSPQDARRLLRAAFRTWITQVRPALAAQNAGPCSAPAERCVLLSDAKVSLAPDWSVTGATVDDGRRPFLVPTSLLQELAFQEPAAVESAPYRTVAAGYFRMDLTPVGQQYNLTVSKAAGAGEFFLSFPQYQFPVPPGVNYIVKGTVVDTNAPGPLRATFEVVGFVASGVWVRILDTSNKALANAFGCMAEISQIGGQP